MALLVGLHFQEAQRMDRGRLAGAVKRSVRTVQRAISELASSGWIEFTNGGNGTPGTIRVINDKAWIMARVSRNGQGFAKDGQGLLENGQGFTCIRSEEVLSKGNQHSPSHSVENQALEDWLELERFAAAHKLPMNNGADFDAAYRLMYERKPPASEGLSMVQAAGRHS
jgi:hypothetical protein